MAGQLINKTNYSIDHFLNKKKDRMSWSKIPYPNWAVGEYKALQEWIETYDRQFTVLSQNTHQQCAILIG